MKNRRNIIESELPPLNPLDIWMKDGKFYRSTKKGWTLIEDQMEFTDSKLMSKSTATSGTIGVNKDTGEASIYNDVAKKWSPLGGGLTETTWQELKDKRDNGQLIPGSLYRITDYQCTTTQENTQSANHQFDIVLLALSENKLAEEGWAMMHDNDVYSIHCSDGVDIKVYINIIYQEEDEEAIVNMVLTDSHLGTPMIIPYESVSSIVDETTKTINLPIEVTSTQLLAEMKEELPYNYFQNSNLSAWKVWYCLDNDKSRFAWADDSVDEDMPASITSTEHIFYRKENSDINDLYGWYSDAVGLTYYTESETPSIGDTIYDDRGEPYKEEVVESYTPAHEGTGLPNGRGVIYRLIDEFNNDIKYDFKNIQFKRKLTDGSYDANGTETWCYTLNVWYNDMCQDASIVGNTLPNSWNYISGVYDNVFGYATAMDLSIEGANTFAFVLGNNVVLSFLQFSRYSGIYSNTIGNSFHSNTIGDNFNSNIIGNYFSNNTIGNGFAANIIRNGFGNNTIGNDFYGNTIGNDFINKNISDHTQYKNYGNNGVELATKS